MNQIEPPSKTALALRCWQFAAILLLASGLALCVDHPLSRWFLAGNTPDAVKKLCGLGEAFGHGLSVPFFLLAVWLLDSAHRRHLIRIGFMAFGAGIASNAFKLAVGRFRPHKFDFSHQVMDSFTAWLPLGSTGSGLQSFPSSHTATAAGLAIGLAWLYPRGRWLFAFLVCLVAGQRMTSGYHFLSDTLFGAAVGFFCAGCCLHPRFLGTRFSRWERGAASRPTDGDDSHQTSDAATARAA
jgi:membrane-associated phospholipid phosphatase